MSDPWVPYPGERPAFTVQRPLYGPVEGGDFTRGKSGAKPQSAVRFGFDIPSSQDIAEQSSLVSWVSGYDSIVLKWGWPKRLKGWSEIVLIRSGFGHPSTPNDGEVVYSALKIDFPDYDEDDEDAPGPEMSPVTDSPLQPGRWYYYTLFFFVGNEWVPSLYTSALCPRDFKHRDHLFNSVPPYYQYIDGQYRGEHGYLRQFLTTFGFELDQIREYVEAWQDTYHTDFSPMPLLKRVGENLGLPFESGLGEIRYRAMVGQLSQLYTWRGTPEGIRRLVEAASKYESLVTTGKNLMLLPDDSEFRTGPGNWGLFNINNDFTLTAPYTNGSRVEGYGAGVMNVAFAAAHGTADTTIRCGHNYQQLANGEGLVTPNKMLTPKFNGIPVKPGYIYGFSVQYKGPSASPGAAGIRWYGKGGEGGSNISEDTTMTPGAWQMLTHQAEAPAGAYFAVPIVKQTTRAAGAGYSLMGAMFYEVGKAGTVVALAPDYYLTLASDSELLGVPIPPETTPVIGDTT